MCIEARTVSGAKEIASKSFFFHCCRPNSQGPLPCPLQVLARNFESSPNFGKFDQKTVKSITDLLPVDLPLELVRETVACDDDAPSLP